MLFLSEENYFSQYIVNKKVLQSTVMIKIKQHKDAIKIFKNKSKSEYPRLLID
jgi:hypothetical protein